MFDYKLHGINSNLRGLLQSAPVTESVTEKLKKNTRQKDYLPVKDLYPLKEAVADYNCRKNGICYSGEEAHCHVDYNKTRIVILNYPSNSVGITLIYSVEELKNFSLQESMLHYLGEHSTFPLISVIIRIIRSKEI